MFCPTVRVLVSLILVCTVSSLTASSAIGLASANGSFQVNSSNVRGNATLFDGTVIETARSSSDLWLNNGAQMRLSTGSRAKVYHGRLLLEKGGGQFASPAGYAVEARSLKVSSASPDTVARVQLAGPGQVMVSSLKGTVRVTNATGILVAALEAGRSLSFDPQAGAAGPVRLSGCLISKEGQLLVADQTTNVMVQVIGNGLANEIGNRVEISGAADPRPPAYAGASELVNVNSFKRLAKGGCSVDGKYLPATGRRPAGAMGFAGGSTLAILGGVAVAAVVGGLAAAGTFSGEETISR